MKTIKVTGIGRASIRPNQIELRIFLNTFYSEYDKVINLHNENLIKISEVFEKNNINKEEIKTINYQVNPRYESIKKENKYVQELKGYEISQRLMTKLDYDIELLNSILNDISLSNIECSLNVSFTIRNPEQFNNLILENAYKDAMIKVETLAKITNQKVKGIVGIDYSNSDLSFVSDTSLSSSEPRCFSMPNRLVAQDITKSDHVTITFELI